nr:immunoglobulin heavy chain junction region [Macaca mulatta]MOV48261.1 immunoglobulin heavy chain junction region [Macaca mulatta]
CANVGIAAAGLEYW